MRRAPPVGKVSQPATPDGRIGENERGRRPERAEARPERVLRTGPLVPRRRDRSGQLPAGVTYTMAYELSFAAFLMTIETP